MTWVLILNPKDGIWRAPAVVGGYPSREEAWAAGVEAAGPPETWSPNAWAKHHGWPGETFGDSYWDKEREAFREPRYIGNGSEHWGSFTVIPGAASSGPETVQVEPRIGPLVVEVEISCEQVKAGRALLGWSQRDLAKNSGLGVATINRIEGGGKVVRRGTVNEIEKAFNRAGVNITSTGVTKVTP